MLPDAAERHRGVISLHGMCFSARHGVYDFEKETPQRFVVDVDLTTTFPTDDQLVGTVDYSELIDRIADVVLGEPMNLLETLAERISELCLREELATEVVVRVGKPDVSLRVPTDVSVVIRRVK